MTQRHHNEKWTHEEVRHVASLCETRNEFRKRFAGAEKWAIRKGIYEEVCSHMRPQFRWTFDLVKQEALKYSSRAEFHEGNPSAAQWATRNRRMDELFDHKLTFWDLSSVSEEALKYTSREDFRKNSAGAAQWAARNGVWDAVCAHMDLAGTSDYDCVYIWKPSGFSNVYKIGVTSKRLGLKRIEYVSRVFGFGIDFLFLKNTEDALQIERRMLALGVPAKVGPEHNGFTEFRELTSDEFLVCLDMLDFSPREEAST